MTRRAAPAVAALVFVLLGVTACGPRSTGDGRPTVVAGFYPLAEVARTIGGTGVRVVDLTPPGVEPHDLELSTRQVDEIEDAEVVLYLGRRFQPALAKVAARTSGRALNLLPSGVVDPHIWLDPIRMEGIVSNVAAALAAVEPPAAAGYRARARVLRAALEGLDAEYRAGLSRCRRRVLVTAHEAFGHLARRYGLDQRGITGLSPESEPDPRRMAALADLVRDTGTTTVFFEELASPRIARALAREAGVRAAALDPIETLSSEARRTGAGYLPIMRSNLRALRAALGCP